MRQNPRHARPLHPMTLPIATPFGDRRPAAWIGALVSAAQCAPQNWLGQQFAQIARRLVLALAPLPIDVAVGSIRMRCHLRDNNSERKFVFMPWRFDRRERDLLVDALPPDGTFVDIGANVGIYTLTAATHLSAQGRVLALEPNPPAAARLRFNIEATRAGRSAWPRVEVLELGVSDRAGEFDLHLDAHNLGGSSIADHAVAAGARPGGVTRVRCLPLALILAEQRVERIDVLKIDIEGAEDMALVPFLESAADSQLPRLLIVENSEHLWTRDLVGELGRRGYEVRLRTRMNAVYGRAVQPNANAVTIGA